MNTQDILPELSLLAGIVDRAVRDVVEEKNILLVRKAREWIRSNSREEWSFLWCCEHIEIDPERLREALQNEDFCDRNTQKPSFDAMIRKFSRLLDGDDFELVTGREKLRYG